MNPQFPIILPILLFSIFSCKNETTTNTNEGNTAVVYYGGDILTMEGESPEFVEAVLVKDGKIKFVGEADEAMNLAESGHKMIDLDGKTLLPGLIDGHAHFGSFSAQAIGAQILPPPDAGANTIPKIIEILKAWNTPENRALTGWIFGMGFDDSVLEEGRFPTKFDLDQVTTEHPIMIIHISGHFAVVNSKGLEILNITSATKDPEGGIIRRTDNNEPNGVLEELAGLPHYAKALTPVSEEAANRFFEAGQEMALSYGYTTAQEGRAMDQTMFTKAAESNALKLDVVAYIDYAYVDDIMSTKWNSKSYNNHYRIGGMKITLDGSPQGRTAWRTEPYLLKPHGTQTGYLGYPAFPNENDAIDLFKKGYENNWQILAHANGDAAIDQFIKATRIATDAYGNNDRRTTLIHGQYIREDQLDSLKTLNVIASLFPLHTFYWGDWHKEIIGEALGNKISPVRTALDKGLNITIHTDAPVALPNLMRMVGISVERKSRSGNVIGANEKLTPYEALRAITIWAAYQHFEENSKGSLKAGKLADLVILDKNPLKVDASEIKNIQVLETIKEGNSVFKR